MTRAKKEAEQPDARLSVEEIEGIRDSFALLAEEPGIVSPFWRRNISDLLADHDALIAENEWLRAALAARKEKN